MLDAPGEYKESISVEEYNLSDNPSVEIYVPPGQSHRRDSTWADLLAGVTSGAYRGIILMSSFGYHTLGQISYTDTRFFDKEDPGAFLPHTWRTGEPKSWNVMSPICNAVRLSRGKVWMLSLISKQDLWWPQRTSVEAHYKVGEYGKTIEDLQNQCGRARFRHEFVFASLVICNFDTGMNERLRPNAEGYDQRLQVRSLRCLLETIASLKEWGKKNDRSNFARVEGLTTTHARNSGFTYWSSTKRSYAN